MKMMWWAAFLFAGAVYPASNPSIVILLFNLVLACAWRWAGSAGRGKARGRPLWHSGVYPRALRAWLVCSTGIVLWSGASIARYRLPERSHSFRGHGPEIIFTARKTLTDSLDDGRLTKRSRELLAALLLADRSGLDLRLRETYEYLGIAHFLALSGLHLGIISIAFLRVISAFRLGGHVRTFVLLAVLSAYAAVAGFPPSLVRALALLTAVIGYRSVCIRVSLIRALVSSAVVLAVIDYPLLFNPGFQLSFTAVGGIALLGLPGVKAVERYLPPGRPGRFLRFLLIPLIITCSIQFFSLPLVLHYFRRVSLFAPLVNIAVILPVTALLYMGLVYLFIPLPLLRDALAAPVNIVSDLLWRIPEFFARRPHPGICSSDVETLLHICATLLLVLGIRFKRGLRYALLGASLAFFLLSFVLAGSAVNEPGSRFSRVRPTAEGIYECSEGQNLLVLSGSASLILGVRTDWYEARRLVKALWASDVKRIDHLLVIDAGKTSRVGVIHILKRIDVGEVCCSPYMPPSFNGIADQAGTLGIRVRTLCRGDLIDLGGGWIDILGPDFPLPRGGSLDSGLASLRCRIMPGAPGANDSVRVFAYSLTSPLQ